MVESLEKWGVKISQDQAYIAKRKAMDLIQSASCDQFNYLRSYTKESLKSNPKSTMYIQYAESKGNHVF